MPISPIADCTPPDFPTQQPTTVNQTSRRRRRNRNYYTAPQPSPTNQDEITTTFPDDQNPRAIHRSLLTSEDLGPNEPDTIHPQFPPPLVLRPQRPLWPETTSSSTSAVRRTLGTSSHGPTMGPGNWASWDGSNPSQTPSVARLPRILPTRRTEAQITRHLICDQHRRHKGRATVCERPCAFPLSNPNG